MFSRAQACIRSSRWFRNVSYASKKTIHLNSKNTYSFLIYLNTIESNHNRLSLLYYSEYNFDAFIIIHFIICYSIPIFFHLEFYAFVSILPTDVDSKTLVAKRLFETLSYWSEIFVSINTNYLSYFFDNSQFAYECPQNGPASDNLAQIKHA